MTSASPVLMETLGSSRHGGDAAEIAQLRGQATPSLTGSGRTEYERRLAVAVHASTGSVASVARAFPRCGAWRRGRRAMRRCDPDFRSVGYIEDELEVSCGESALSAEGGARATGSARLETFVAVVRAPMQKFCFPCFLCFATLTPNQAMQLTATRCAFTFHDDFHTSTAITARSR